MGMTATNWPGLAWPRRWGMNESNLEDRAAIHDLFTRYCCALDNGEIEAVVDCFTADAILKSPVIDIRGRDEIRAFAGRFAAQRTVVGFVACRHGTLLDSLQPCLMRAFQQAS